MIALVDMDDTLVSLQRQILRYINTKSAQPYVWEEISRARREGSDPAYQLLVKEFLSQSHLSLAAPIYPSVRQGILRLKAAGYQIHIASARKDNLHQTTVDWLKLHGLLPHIDAVHARPATQHSHEFKIATARKVGATVAFDDTYDVATALADSGVYTYLISKPWNQWQPRHPFIRRVSNFATAVRIEMSRPHVQTNP